MELETRAIHAGRAADPSTGAISPPIYLSTTFERAADGSYPQGFTYSRTENPNRNALETALANLEGGQVAMAFSSGMAAIQAVLMALQADQHVLLPDDCYHGVRRLMRDVLEPWGLQVSYVDQTDLTAVAAAIQPNTKLVWVETPSNPLLKVCDIAALAQLAHAAGAWCVVDGTFATPVLQQPLALGADAVVHATTKFLGGHSDLLGGVVVCAQENELSAKVRTGQQAGGAVPSPFDCWLLLRSLATLPYRVRAQANHALQIAHWLAQQPQVVRVHYPGLPSHPGYALAQQQMPNGFGAMLSVQVQGGVGGALAVAAAVKLFTRATSLGGVESLIEHRASVEGPDTTTPGDLLRLSIGLEHPSDLMADLQQAFAQLTASDPDDLQRLAAIQAAGGRKK